MKSAVIFSFLIIFFCLFPLTSATSTSIFITPSDKTLTTGETIIVSLIITPDQEVDTVAVDLITWDKYVLNCIGVQQGNFFINPLIWMPGKINNSAGTLTGLLMASSEPTQTPDILCNITFQAKNPGSSAININFFGVARNGTDIQKEILNSCQITVKGPIPPPPPNENNTAPPPHNNETTNQNQTNTLLPPTNTSSNTTNNNTIPPIMNQNSTNTTNPNEGSTNNGIGMPDTISPTIIFYAVIVIITVSIIAYIIVHHLKNKKETDEEQKELNLDDYFFPSGGTDETDSGSQLQE